MTDILDDEDENTARRKKKSGGEGEAAGAGNAIARMLTTKKAQQVDGERRHLVGNDLIEALVEFCADGIMRASANLTVVWDKSFAIVNSFINFCNKELPKLAKNLQRMASRGARAPVAVKQKAPGNNLGMSFGPTGPTE